MIPQTHISRVVIDNQTLTFETGKLAKQAGGSVVVRQGDTMVLVTACAAARPREGVDFLPLTVDYREYTYASGRIPGGFFKREGMPAQKETLTSRLIDRPLRPLFPDGWRRETQIIAMVISADGEHDADVLAITGASAALALSPIPQTRVMAAVRIGLIGYDFVVNPTFAQRRESKLDLVVAGTAAGLVMVEAGATEIPEGVMVAALDRAHEAIRTLVAGIEGLVRECDVSAEPPSPPPASSTGDTDDALAFTWIDTVADAMRVTGQQAQVAAVAAVRAQFVAAATADGSRDAKAAGVAFGAIKERVLRREVLEYGRRLDGRAFDEIRPIEIETSVLPRVHGSAVFTRGETQAQVTATLGTASDRQRVEGMEGEYWKRFMLHYNFPAFSVGEVAFMRGPGRREIGHGALAERALAPVFPSEEVFPYTVRLVADIFESNGSSSMASVCGGTLALFDAGVPITAPVAGVAMGLIVDEASGRHVVLTDIAGAEDHYGDMDFKVAGTRDGITALQMDIKVGAVPMAVMNEALEQARRGRLFILGHMSEALDGPRAAVSKHAPRILTIRIPTERIRDVIGSGGKTIRGLVERTGAKIDVEDDGRVNVASSNEEAAALAVKLIRELTATPELDEVYEGTVTRITDFGAFVEIMPGRDGLLHVSEVAHYRVRDVRDEMKEGDAVRVKVINIDPSGKVRLSRKVLLAVPAADTANTHDEG